MKNPGVPAILRALVAAAEKAHRELGWKPKYPKLEDIVRSAWLWHQSHPDGYKD